MAEPRTNEDRCDAWYDGSAICVIAIGSHGDPLDLAEHEVEALINKLQSSLNLARSEITKTDSLISTNDHQLSNEAQQIQNLVSGKELARVLRPRPNEVALEFSDGTRFFIETKSTLEFSVT